MEPGIVLVTRENIEYFRPIMPNGAEIGGESACIGAVTDDGEPIGVLIWTELDTGYRVDWIYVRENYRRKQIGKVLFRKLISIISRTGEVMPISARFEQRDDSALMEFFVSLKDVDVHFLNDRFYVTKDEIKNSSISGRKGSIKEEPERFLNKRGEVSNDDLATLLDAGLYVYDKKTFFKGLVNSLSYCYREKDKLKAAVLITDNGDDELALTFLYGSNTPKIMNLLTTVADKIVAEYPKAHLTYETVSDKTRELSQYLFPDARHTQIYEAYFCGPFA